MKNIQKNAYSEKGIVELCAEILGARIEKFVHYLVVLKSTLQFCVANSMCNFTEWGI